MSADPIRRLRDGGFDVEVRNHAEAVLGADFPDAMSELTDALLAVEIPTEELIRGGGGEAPSTQRLRRILSNAGWPKHKFLIRKFVDDVEREAVSHEIDHVRMHENGLLALEIEWNNKDPFFDRDLENFQRLHAEGAISVGIIVTRGKSLQDGLFDVVLRVAIKSGVGSPSDLQGFFGLEPTSRQRQNVERRMGSSGEDFVHAWAKTFVADKFGAATTHWTKLEERIQRGVGNPCPLLLIGLPLSAVR